MPASAPRTRLRPRLRSLRGRVTVLVTLLATVLFIPAGVAAGLLARHALVNAAWRQVRQEAAVAAADVRRGELARAVIPRVSGVDLIQVVGPGRVVLASSAAARGLPPLAGTMPTSQDTVRDVQACAAPPAGCMRISAVRVRPTPDSPVVYAGRRVPGRLSTGIFDTLFAVQVVALIGLAAWGAWKVTGRMLRPVEAIRAELAAINVNDLSTRVPEPAGQNEIAQLARTINATLNRLEQAKGGMERMLDQQRRFASDASHELRNPIAGLRLLLEDTQLDLERNDLPATLDRALEDIDRLQAITTDLLLLAQLQADPPTSVQRIDLARFVRTEVSRRTDRHPVQLDLQPGVTVDAVPTHIGRILANLLDNAQRHAETTVRVNVRASGHEQRNSAELAVSDDGTGIPEADRERVFERFTRLRAARQRDPQGTGLGLAIARTIAQAHKGTLHVADSPIGGACFILRLPSAPQSADECSNDRDEAH
ncbi:sensor histidine kinase [Actinomadura alba]|uniref:histidine kinase n=1 Tax=Actinomadura alba TaxID=406431 RepID=A0ABR7LP38_9ACTN|nr:HAMP domain-containing sensor histidine kinase [Actinomadura alba]MBC6466443.1 HAMP domain-containing histidine kinase [Actinomadura alba]